MTSEDSDSQDIWLSEKQQDVWLDVWTMRIGLPARLDAQLKEAAGLSHFEYFTMAQISMSPHHRLRMSELAELADMTLSHLSRVVTRLEKAGWVKRVPDPDDGRATVAVLTESGWNKVEETAPGHVQEVRRIVFDDLTDEELEVFGTAMKKIVARLGMSGKLPRV